MKFSVALSALVIATNAMAQNCDSVIALSKVRSTVVSDRTEVESHASNFCNEYSKTKGDSKSFNAGASYKFLSASMGSQNASMESVASRYCSASASNRASSDAFRQYIESISPNAYSAYEQCVKMQRDVRFEVDTSTMLPTEFSMAVRFASQVQSNKDAKLLVSSAAGAKCKWRSVTTDEVVIPTGTSQVLTCTRSDQTKRSFVSVVRTDTAASGESLNIPWVAYDAQGRAIDPYPAPVSVDQPAPKKVGCDSEGACVRKDGTCGSVNLTVWCANPDGTPHGCGTVFKSATPGRDYFTDADRLTASTKKRAAAKWKCQ